MRVAIIGRSELLFETAKSLREIGCEIALVVTAKEAPEYRVTARDYENFSCDVGAKYIYTPKINEAEIVREVTALGPIDLAVSINYSGIISSEVIALFKLGILNAHGGDLPRYRGNACQAWAILNGEKRVAMCIHKMIGGELDNGDIIARDYLDITIDTKIGAIYQWMEKVIPLLMLESVEKLCKNPQFILESQSKDPERALRCYPRKPEDGKIDWSQTNTSVLRLINASSSPFAGAFCTFQDKKLVITDAELVTENENFLGVPGQVAKVNAGDGSVEILTGMGKIRLRTVEIDGQTFIPSKLITSLRSRLK